MTKQPEDRYQDILKRIAERRPFGSAVQQPQTPPERALDLINAYDALAELTQSEYPRILCYGPKQLSGGAWTGVALWHRRKGYHGYQTLWLLGVWAHYLGQALTLSIGERALPYRAPIYDAGVYRVAIENGFRLYYEDDGGPPQAGDRLLYQAAFEPRERLKPRQALDRILETWQSRQEAV